MSTQPNYSEMTAPRPSEEALRNRFAELASRFDAAQDADTRQNVLWEWDDERRHFQTWAALARLKFAQDTTDEAAKAEREYADELRAVYTELEVELKQRYLDSGRDIADNVGEHVFALWTSDVTAFRPEISEETVEESKRAADYTELISSAEIEFRGETYNLSGLARFMSDAHRDTRYSASKKMWDFFADNGDAIDTIYDDLVKL
jgi:oligoendopeptidase F